AHSAESKMPSVRSIILNCVLSLTMVTASAAATTETTNELNLRSGPSVHYSVVAVVPTGSSIDIVSCDSDWCNLTWGKYQGFTEGRFLLTHVTAKVSPLDALKPEVPGETRDIEELQQTLMETCDAEWGQADLDGDGVLSAAEIAHYNADIR